MFNKKRWRKLTRKEYRYVSTTGRVRIGHKGRRYKTRGSSMKYDKRARIWSVAKDKQKIKEEIQKLFESSAKGIKGYSNYGFKRELDKRLEDYKPSDISDEGDGIYQMNEKMTDAEKSAILKIRYYTNAEKPYLELYIDSYKVKQ